MRRKDREKDSAFAYEILRDCEYAMLATVNADGTPYCIAISPVLVGDAVYFHCAMEGQKIDNINRNSAVCISCVGRTKLIPEQFATEYESAVAIGKCEIVLDNAEKLMALRALCEKYAKSNMSEFDKAVANALNHTCICKINIEKITGKARVV